MSDKLSMLPNWKKGASLPDRLDEIATYARVHPERFERFVCAFLEIRADETSVVRVISHGCDVAQEVGMFQLGIDQTIRNSQT